MKGDPDVLVFRFCLLMTCVVLTLVLTGVIRL